MSANTFRHNQNQQKAHAVIPVHHVHSLTTDKAGDTDPQRFIGQWGTISIDYVNQVLRIHDEVTPGGVAVSPMFANAPPAVPGPMYPFTPLEWGPVTFVPGVPQLFTHNFGRFASTRLIDALTGAEIVASVVHTLPGRDSFTVETTVAAVAYVIAQ